MPEAVEARATRRPRDLQTIEHGIQHVPPENVCGPKLAIWLSEHPVSRLAANGACLVAAKDIHQQWAGIQNSDTCFSLRSYQLSVPEAVSNANGLRFEVDVVPRQRQQLTNPKSRASGTREERAMLVRERCQDLLYLFRRPYWLFGMNNFWFVFRRTGERSSRSFSTAKLKMLCSNPISFSKVLAVTF